MENTQKNTRNGFATVPLLLTIIVVLLVVGGGAYFAMRQQPTTQEAPAVKAVKKINWIIEQENPVIVPGKEYEKDRQLISIDVTFTDNSTKRYSLGKDYGCTGSNDEPFKGDKQNKVWFGQVECNFALTSVGYVAYSQDGRFVVERNGESAKDGSFTKTVVLEI